MDVVTGEMASPLIHQMMDELHRQYPMVEVTVHTIKNKFFGGNGGGGPRDGDRYHCPVRGQADQRYAGAGLRKRSNITDGLERYMVVRALAAVGAAVWP